MPTAIIPAAPLVPPRRSLLTSAQVIDGGDLRWVNGLWVDPEDCGGYRVYDSCDPTVDFDFPSPDRTGAADPLGTEPDYRPFTVEGAAECSTVQAAVRNLPERAQRVLAACEPKAVERELWTGELADAAGHANRRLAGPDTEVLAGGVAQKPKRALALLEAAFAACGCGGRAMIHVPIDALTMLWTGVRLDGNLLLTLLDSIVVPGTGYPGSSPTGDAAADGTAWVYATGLVTVRRTPVETLPGSDIEATDRAVNTVRYTAERTVAATWDGCCAHGVLVNLND